MDVEVHIFTIIVGMIGLVGCAVGFIATIISALEEDNKLANILSPIGLGIAVLASIICCVSSYLI